MMHYFIDGYNLMFRILRAGDDLARQREQIIEEIYRKVSYIGLDVTIVFDSQYNINESTRSNLKQMSIYFTDYHETADEYILEELKNEKHPSHHIVVTSDKKLAYLARLRSAKTETVEDFIQTLNKRFKNKIRHKNAPPEIPRAIITPKPVTKKQEPTSKTTAEECFDFYLDRFEAEFKEIISVEPVPKNVKSKAKPSKKDKVKKPKKDQINIAETWLKAFERNLDNESDLDQL